MWKPFQAILIATALASGAAAQPVISSVVNAASNRARSFPFSSIARGALAVAYGSGMGPAALVQVAEYPLRPALEGTSVTIRIGATSIDGLMVYTFANQIAFIVPSRTPTGAGEVRVTYNGQTSAPAPISVADTNLAIYTWTQNGNGQAVATNALNGVVSLEQPAKPNDIVSIWSTGLGPVEEDDSARPTVRDLPIGIEAVVGNRRAEILYRGRTACCSALDQIVIRIPADTAIGCAVPIYFRSDAFVSNVVPLPISSDGAPCSDPLEARNLNVAGKDRVRVGTLLLDRVNDRAASGAAQVFDFAHFTFLQYDRAYYNNYRGLAPAPGTCFVAHFDNNSRFDPTRATLLNVGSPIRLTVQGVTFSLPRDDFGGYGQFFQGRNPNDVSGPGVLTGPGGPDLGAFSINHNLPDAPTSQWREWATLSDVPTSQPLTISWTNGPADGIVTISGQTSGSLNVEFACSVSGGETQFVIPADILRLMSPGPGSIGVVFERPVPVSNVPASLDAFIFDRDVRFTRPVTFR